MYMIDKVVRSKALKGPIGVDNSEVINLEQEKELKKRDKYYADLAEKKKPSGESEEDDEDYLDEEDEDMDPQTRENIVNEKLLKRLYKAAQADIDAQENEDERAAKVQFDEAGESKLGQVDKSMLEMHIKNEKDVAKA